jgi:hypothetical protein
MTVRFGRTDQMPSEVACGVTVLIMLTNVETVGESKTCAGDLSQGPALG